MKFITKLIATFFGLGYCPIAPGTLTSLVVLLLRRYLWPLSGKLPLEIAALLILIILGCWASNFYVRSAHKDDPREIVIDEACGQFLAFIALPPSNLNLCFSFILFRALDIIKPFPINRVEKLRGGWGIMADDLAAGFLVRLLVGLYLYIFR